MESNRSTTKSSTSGLTSVLMIDDDVKLGLSMDKFRREAGAKLARSWREAGAKLALESAGILFFECMKAVDSEYELAKLISDNFRLFHQ